MKNLLLLVLSTFVCVSSIMGQWISDPSVNNSVWLQQNNIDNFEKQMVTDGNGGAIILWTWGFFNPAKVQKIDSSGNTQWSMGLAISDSVASAFLESDGNGGAYIVYQVGFPSINTDVRAQHVSAGGGLLWGAEGSTVLVSPMPKYLSSVINGGKGLIIAWYESTYTDPVTGYWNGSIRAQSISSNGTISWGANGVLVSDDNTAAPFWKLNPKMVPDNQGGAFVAWIDGRNQNNEGNDDIYLQHINNQGQRILGNDLAICNSPFQQFNHKITSDGIGGAIVSWDGNYDVTGSVSQIYGQRIANTGTLLWNNNGVPFSPATLIVGQLGYEYYEIISDGLNGAYIAWEDMRSNGPGIYACRIKGNGNLAWEAPVSLGYLPDLGATSLQPKLALDHKKGAIISWVDSRSGKSDIYAQHIDSSGSILEVQNGLPVCNQDSLQWQSRILGVGKQGAIVIWNDSRLGAGNGSLSCNIYASRIFTDTSNTQVVDTTTFISNVTEEQPRLVLYPNPATDYIEVTTNNVKRQEFIITDIQGRNLLRKESTGGKVSIDISGLAKGVYCVKSETSSIFFIKE